MPANKFYEGLEAVVYIALNSGAGPVSSKDICKSQAMLPRHLEPVMQQLVQNGVLKGTKGPKGGYTLAKEKRKITAGSIYRIFSKSKASKQEVSQLSKKVIKPLYNEVKKVMLQKLDLVTVEDLCKNAADPTKKADGSESFDI